QRRVTATQSMFRLRLPGRCRAANLLRTVERHGAKVSYCRRGKTGGIMRGMRGVKRLLPLILLAVLAGDVASRRPAAAEERPAERDFRTEFQQSFTAVPDLKSLT